MKDIKFVGLHAHTGFSTFDGLGYPDEHIDYVMETGGDALAITLSVNKKITREDFGVFHPGGSLGKKLQEERE